MNTHVDIPELVRLLKISLSKLPHRSEHTLAVEWCWRIAMPRMMTPEEQLQIVAGLDLPVGQYRFCGNTDNNGRGHVMKIFVNQV